VSRFSEARDQITGNSWLDDLARASLSAADAKFSPRQDTPSRRLRVYIEPRDAWIGVYVANDAVYVCPLPFVVFRWRRNHAR
jgi:hypothetical protein